MNLQDSVASLKGVGKKRLPLLEKLHIETIEDLLRFFPRRYEDRRQAVPIMTAPLSKEVLIIGTVMSKQMVGSPYSRSCLRCRSRIIPGVWNCCFLTENFWNPISNPVSK